MNIRFKCKTGDKVTVRRFDIAAETEHTELVTVIKSTPKTIKVKAFGGVKTFWRDGKIYGKTLGGDSTIKSDHVETFKLI